MAEPGSDPGLVMNSPIEAGVRSNFFRVSGTAIHSIEFGVVSALGLALTLHFALFSTSVRQRWRWWSAVAVITASLPLTVARSATIGAVVAVITLFITWPRAWKIRALMVAPVGLVALRLAFPGVLGTIWSMFTWLRQDSSASARLTDYGKVWDLLSPDPVFGRGVGTFLPELYFILDNQYMMALVTTGILGLAALFSLMAIGIGTTVATRRRYEDPASRHLVQSLLAGLLVVTVSWSFFDGFSFAQATGRSGCCSEESPASTASPPRAPQNHLRRWAAEPDCEPPPGGCCRPQRSSWQPLRSWSQDLASPATSWPSMHISSALSMHHVATSPTRMTPMPP